MRKVYILIFFFFFIFDIDVSIQLIGEDVVGDHGDDLVMKFCELNFEKKKLLVG